VNGLRDFDAVWCTCLERCHERRKLAEQHLARIGIADMVTWSTGVDMPDNPQLGCLHSHLLALKYLRDTPTCKHLLFLEDDAEFWPDAGELMGEFWRQLRDTTPTWDVLYLGHNPASARVMGPVSPNLRRMNGCLCAHAYAVRRSAARFLIDVVERYLSSRPDGLELVPYDLLIVPAFSYLVVYATTPILAYQRPVYSELEGRKVDYGKWR
jgi:GR25 family glycosyltransferase involved in LPS biosynthesis